MSNFHGFDGSGNYREGSRWVGQGGTDASEELSDVLDAPAWAANIAISHADYPSPITDDDVAGYVERHAPENASDREKALVADVVKGRLREMRLTDPSINLSMRTVSADGTVFWDIAPDTLARARHLHGPTLSRFQPGASLGLYESTALVASRANGEGGNLADWSETVGQDKQTIRDYLVDHSDSASPPWSQLKNEPGTTVSLISYNRRADSGRFLVEYGDENMRPEVIEFHDHDGREDIAQVLAAEAFYRRLGSGER